MSSQSQTRIFDEAVESRRRLLAQQQAPPDVTQALHQHNVVEACRLGAYLYLQPEGVLTWCDFWIKAYYNCELDERDQLGDLVHQLLYYAPQLTVLAGESTPLSNAGNHALRSEHLLRFGGSGRCAIRLQYCQESLQLPMIHALSELCRHENQCFLNATTDALDSELRLDSFAYDNVLQYLYEPSFFVLTLYRVHLLQLLDVVHNRAQYALGRHTHTVKAIAHQAVDWERVQRALSLTPEALRLLQFELALLHQTLDTSDLQQCLRDLDALWHEKASQCFLERKRRTASLLGQ